MKTTLSRDSSKGKLQLRKWRFEFPFLSTARIGLYFLILYHRKRNRRSIPTSFQRWRYLCKVYAQFERYCHRNRKFREIDTRIRKRLSNPTSQTRVYYSSILNILISFLIRFFIFRLTKNYYEFIFFTILMKNYN